MTKSSLTENPYVLTGTKVFVIRSRILDRDFEVSICLPPSYSMGNRIYPALIQLDPQIGFPIAALAARSQSQQAAIDELIVVGVGTPLAEGDEATFIRRLYELTPGVPAAEQLNSLVARMLESRIARAGLTWQQAMGGAPKFLKFLVSELLPILLSQFRLDSKDLGICGHSAGGAFVSYVLTEPTTIFRKFLCGTFSTLMYGDALPRREAQLASQPIAGQRLVFHAVGGSELSDPALADTQTGFDLMTRLGCISGFEVSTRVFDGETHSSVFPMLIASGIRRLWSSGHRFAEAAARFSAPTPEISSNSNHT